MRRVTRAPRSSPGYLRRRRSPYRRAVLGLVLASSALLSVGGAAAVASPGTTSGGSFPVSVSASNGTVRITARPARIISLSPTATDMLFSIGAGPQVVAVDNDSTYPASAPRTSLSGLTPNLEAIAKYRPDLVVISYSPNGLTASLGRLGIPVLLEEAPSDLAGTYSQIEQLGAATGHVATSEAEVATMRRTIASSVATTPRFSPPLRYYYELGQDYYSVTSSTFIGAVLGEYGLHDIADAAKDASSGYPQLSAEYIVKENPQVIFLADTICCGQSAKTVAKRPGWGSIAAVRSGAIVPLNDSIASQWGPRIVTLYADVHAALERLKAEKVT